MCQRASMTVFVGKRENQWQLAEALPTDLQYCKETVAKKWFNNTLHTAQYITYSSDTYQIACGTYFKKIVQPFPPSFSKFVMRCDAMPLAATGSGQWERAMHQPGKFLVSQILLSLDRTGACASPVPQDRFKSGRWFEPLTRTVTEHQEIRKTNKHCGNPGRFFNDIVIYIKPN